ncbi:MAG: sensor histidine kinase [Puniceicoccaceae bacterium]|nr:MAG: sensor histidine kinase [Puniceicoccaceae bacterium]
MKRVASWIVVIIPALAVGALALVLLHREELRLREREEAARQALQEAAMERMHGVADSLALSGEEVREGILIALAALPREEPFVREHQMRWLELWSRTNPLVRTGLLWLPEEGWVLPRPGESSQDAVNWFRLQGFMRESPPWAGPGAKAVREAEDPGPEDEVAADVSTDRMQQLPEAVAEVGSENVQRFRQVRRELAHVAQQTPLDMVPFGLGNFSAQEDVNAFAPPSAGAKAAMDARVDEAERPARAEAGLPRSGWLVHGEGAEHRLIAWLKEADGVVRAAELDQEELARRLAAALPTGGFALRNPRGHQWPGPIQPTVELRLDGLLAGWRLLHEADRGERSGTGALALPWLGALFTVAVVAMIITGGSSLLLQARQAEREARQRKGFVTSVSHEFKTPLTTIRLYTDLLRRNRAGEDQKRREYLDTIAMESDRLGRMVEAVLDLGRLEAGVLRPEREPVDLPELVRDLVRTLEPRLARAGLEVQCHGLDRIARAAGDAGLIRQILLNLLDNAIKYGAGGKRIDLLLLPHDGRWRLEVADRGPGVSTEFVPRLFGRFERADTRLEAEQPGAGLGLSLAREFARVMEGDLIYRPRHGGGAVFALELPTSGEKAE